MDGSFTLLMEDKIDWPCELSEEQKIELMTQALNYICIYSSLTQR